jgi:hypothetical protein
VSNGVIEIEVVSGDPRLVQNTRIRRGLEGPQLIVEWDAPAQITTAMEIRVVRKKFEFAANPFDSQGTVVFEGPADAGFVTDIDLDPCECYYYTVFSHNFFVAEEWLFGPESQVSEIAIPTGFFGRDGGLFKRLPELYMLEDKLLELDVVQREESFFALYPTLDPENHEWFNLGENTDPTKEAIKKGPLQRFLKTIAIDLDLAKGLADCMPVLWDVDNTCCGVLPALGENIALQVNRELSCSAQRQEIREHVAILKRKGTADALRARARSVSGFTTFVQEWSNNILLTNTLDRTIIDVPKPGLASTFMLPGDTTDYTPGGVIAPNSFCIFFLLECDDCLSEQIVRKLNRVLPPEFPACHPGHLVFLDCLFEEEPFDRERLDDFNEEIWEDDLLEELILQTCWLITNTLPDDPFLPDPGPGKGLARNLTNSLKALTANPNIICAELWDDEIICDNRVAKARVDCTRVG